MVTSPEHFDRAVLESELDHYFAVQAGDIESAEADGIVAGLDLASAEAVPAGLLGGLRKRLAVLLGSGVVEPVGAPSMESAPPQPPSDYSDRTHFRAHLESLAGDQWRPLLVELGLAASPEDPKARLLESLLSDDYKALGKDQDHYKNQRALHESYGEKLTDFILRQALDYFQPKEQPESRRERNELSGKAMNLLKLLEVNQLFGDEHHLSEPAFALLEARLRPLLGQCLDRFTDGFVDADSEVRDGHESILPGPTHYPFDAPGLSPEDSAPLAIVHGGPIPARMTLNRFEATRETREGGETVTLPTDQLTTICFPYRFWPKHDPKGQYTQSPLPVGLWVSIGVTSDEARQDYRVHPSQAYLSALGMEHDQLDPEKKQPVHRRRGQVDDEYVAHHFDSARTTLVGINSAADLFRGIERKFDLMLSSCDVGFPRLRNYLSKG